MSVTTLTDLVATAARRLQNQIDWPADTPLEESLEQVQYARRCLARAAKKMRRQLRSEALIEGQAVEGQVLDDIDEAEAEGKQQAQDALAGEPWTVWCAADLEGLRFTARHKHDEATIVVTAGSVDALLRAIDAVALEDLEPQERAA